MTISFTSDGTTSQILHNGTVVHDIDAGGLKNLAVANLATEAKPLGAGQTWQDVTASRVLNTTYTNNSGRPIVVSYWDSGSAPVVNAFVNDNIVLSLTDSASTNLGFTGLIVPNGATYKITGGTKAGWWELR